MPNQNDLWAEVNLVKLRVQTTLGPHLSHEFRSSQPYQAYTGLCGEAQMAYDDGELTDELVTLLREQAEKVIALHSTAQ